MTGTMGNENAGRLNLSTPIQRRRRLSNITNVSLSANFSRDDISLKTCSQTGDFELQQENIALKKLLSEKEASIQHQAENMEQLQKEFLSQLRKHSQVNEEIIFYNSRLSKEGAQLRDQLRLVHHEYSQMTAVYKINESELQMKLLDMQEQLRKLHLEMEAKKSCDSTLDKQTLTEVMRKPRGKAYRRHSTAGTVDFGLNWNQSIKENNSTPTVACGGRPGLRPRLGACGNTPLKARLSQPETSVPTGNSSVATAPSLYPGKQANNRYSHVIGLETMQEACEDPDACTTLSTETEQASTAPVESSPSIASVGGTTLGSESNNVRLGDVVCSSDSSSSAVTTRSKSATQISKSNEKTNTVSQKRPSSPAVPHFSRRTNNASVPPCSTGTSRPVRKVVENVATYREPSLSSKMRRPV